jgi:hypothetical protein
MIPVNNPWNKPNVGKVVKRARFVTLILTASAVISAAPAEDLRSTELHSMEAKSLRLGEVNGIAYFTVQGQGYRLAVTFAGLGGSPVRLVSTLLPGQEVAISAAASVGGSGPAIEFSRQSDRLIVATKP